MLKNINLNKLTYEELQLLLKMVELYASDNNPELISLFDKSELQDYMNLILDVQYTSTRAETRKTLKRLKRII